MDIHVVSKADISNHTTIHISDPSLPEHLAPNAIRLKPIVYSLTSNNLVYARFGSLMKWWDAYPIPSTAPPPYNNTDEWGIVPAWGFARVVSTSLPSLPTDTIIWGFLPTSTGPFDLTLTPGALPTQHLETSPHRTHLMASYNTYTAQPALPSPLSTPQLRQMQIECLFRPVWRIGFLLSHFVFGDDSLQIHPQGQSLPWDCDESDLASAVVVNLSASSKAGRCFAWHCLRREERRGPVGLVNVSSKPGVLRAAGEGVESRIAVKNVSYEEAVRTEVVGWIAELKVERVVLVDHGARREALVNLYTALKSNQGTAAMEITLIGVGAEMKLPTAEESAASFAAGKRVGRVQANDAGIWDDAVLKLGAERVDEMMRREYGVWKEDMERLNSDIEVVVGRSVGDVEKGWGRLCKSDVRPSEGLVYIFE